MACRWRKTAAASPVEDSDSSVGYGVTSGDVSGLFGGGGGGATAFKLQATLGLALGQFEQQSLKSRASK